LVILVPARAKVTVGGAVLGPSGETRVIHLPFTCGAIRVCVEVRAEVTGKDDGKKEKEEGTGDDDDNPPPGTAAGGKKEDKKDGARSVTKTACFHYPGETVTLDLRPDLTTPGKK
jgi:hypothetical protein